MLIENSHRRSENYGIENELDNKKINNILTQTYNYMESVIDNFDKGIMIL